MCSQHMLLQIKLTKHRCNQSWKLQIWTFKSVLCFSLPRTSTTTPMTNRIDEVNMKCIRSTTKFHATVTSSDQVIRNQSMMYNEKALGKWVNEKEGLVSFPLWLSVCLKQMKMSFNTCRQYLSLRWQQWQLSKNKWFMLGTFNVEKIIFVPPAEAQRIPSKINHLNCSQPGHQL